MAQQRQRRGTIISVPAWVAADGRIIPLMHMDEEHLQNTVNLIRGRGYVTRDEAEPFPNPPCGLNGEFAIEAAEQAFDQDVVRYMKQKVSKNLKVLETELAKRKRKVK